MLRRGPKDGLPTVGPMTGSRIAELGALLG